jgi:hypothetical protein
VPRKELLELQLGSDVSCENYRNQQGIAAADIILLGLVAATVAGFSAGTTRASKALQAAFCRCQSFQTR